MNESENRLIAAILTVARYTGTSRNEVLTPAQAVTEYERVLEILCDRSKEKGKS
jgi:hypothetical protein